MKLEHLRQRLVHAARSAPVPGHAPAGFEARVLCRMQSHRATSPPLDVARAWLEGLRRAAYLAGGIAACALMVHAFAPVPSRVAHGPAPEPDLLGEAVLADVPGLSDDVFPEESTP